MRIPLKIIKLVQALRRILAAIGLARIEDRQGVKRERRKLQASRLAKVAEDKSVLHIDPVGTKDEIADSVSPEDPLHWTNLRGKIRNAEEARLVLLHDAQRSDSPTPELVDLSREAVGLPCDPVAFARRIGITVWLSGKRDAKIRRDDVIIEETPLGSYGSSRMIITVNDLPGIPRDISSRIFRQRLAIALGEFLLPYGKTPRVAPEGDMADSGTMEGKKTRSQGAEQDPSDAQDPRGTQEILRELLAEDADEDFSEDVWFRDALYLKVLRRNDPDQDPAKAPRPKAIDFSRELLAPPSILDKDERLSMIRLIEDYGINPVDSYEIIKMRGGNIEE